MKKTTKKTARKPTPSHFDLQLTASRKLTKKEEAHLKKAFRVFAEGTAMILDIGPIVTTYNIPGG